MSSGFSGVADRVYENFIMRDLTYIFSGSLLLTTMMYVCEVNIIDVIDYISQNIIKFIIFLGISYLTGFIAFTGIMFIRIFKNVQCVYAPYNEIKILAEIQKKYGYETVKRIERESYLDRFSRTIGSASLISSLILLIPIFKDHRPSDLIIFLISALITVICVLEDRRWFKKLRENLIELGYLDKIENKR